MTERSYDLNLPIAMAKPRGPAARLRSAPKKPRAAAPAAPTARRDHGAERRRAAERQAAELAAEQTKQTRPYHNSGAARNAESELFQEWKAKPSLTVVVQQAREGAQSAKEKRARAGAAARWHPSAAPEAPARRRDNVVPQPEATRSWRVGESEREPASLRQYKSEELVYWAEAIDSGRIKWPELQQLYDAGIIRISRSILAPWIYGVRTKDPTTKKPTAEFSRQPGAWRTLKENGELPPMGRPTLVLTFEQEEALAHIIVIMAARRKPLSPSEIMRWAGACGHENGTLHDPDADVRKWYLLFRLRMKKEFKINIEEVPHATWDRDHPPLPARPLRPFFLPWCYRATYTWRCGLTQTKYSYAPRTFLRSLSASCARSRRSSCR